MAIKKSETVDGAVAELRAADPDEADNLLWEEADSSCTTGYDNDGSTGYEIFQNGLALGEQAAGRDVFVTESSSDNVAWFFLGPEEKVLERIRKLGS